MTTYTAGAWWVKKNVLAIVYFLDLLGERKICLIPNQRVRKGAQKTPRRSKRLKNLKLQLFVFNHPPILHQIRASYPAGHIFQCSRSMPNRENVNRSSTVAVSGRTICSSPRKIATKHVVRPMHHLPKPLTSADCPSRVVLAEQLCESMVLMAKLEDVNYFIMEVKTLVFP